MSEHDSSNLPSDVDRRVVEALDEYLAQAAAGAAPDRSEFLARYPDLADELAECLEGLDFVVQAFSGPGPMTAAEAAQPSARMLGDFQIVREVGRGGMGVVYEARQLSLDRRVALKVLPFAGMLDPRQLQRFKNEAQAAAQLDHPNIVDVIAVGCDRAVHFYAMRFIEGQPLAEVIGELRKPDGGSQDSEVRSQGEGIGVCEPEEHHSHHAPCDGSPGHPYAEREDYGDADKGDVESQITALTPALFPRERKHSEAVQNSKSKIQNRSTAPIVRLSTESSSEYFRSAARLIADVAEALDYAHQVGVIHRDIKPSNILLDVRGKAWITDFGLALVDSRTEMTLTGDLVGTLRYMSPEQAGGNRRSLDHRTDIYSLGATLYELLALRPAFESSNRQELLHQITTVEPLAPGKVRKLVPADLETITLKALEKEPAQRYATAAALADDLRRFLDDKPIRARRAGLAIRLGKWSRRHKSLVGGSAAVLFIAAIALAVSNYRISAALVTAQNATIAANNSAQAEKRARLDLRNAFEKEKRALQAEAVERQQREAVASYFIQAFQRANPLVDGLDLKVVDVLDQAVDKLDDDRNLAPTIKADILHTFGLTYLGLGLPQKSVAVHERLVALRREVLGPEDPATIASLHNLAEAYADAGQYDEAIRNFEHTLAKRSAMMAEDDVELLKNMSNLGRAYRDAGRLDKAIPLLEEALLRMQKKLGAEDHLMLSTIYSLAAAYRDAGRLSDVLPLADTLAIASQKLPPADPVAALSVELLANTYENAGRTAEAIPLLEQAMATARTSLGPDHINTLACTNNLGAYYAKVGRAGDAIPLLEDARAKTGQLLSHAHPLALTIASNLGDAYNGVARFKEAVPLLEDALAKRNERREEDHPKTLCIINNLANAYRGIGRLGDATALLDQVLQKRRAILGPDHPATLATANDLALAYLDAGQLEESVSLFKSVFASTVQKLGPEHADTLRLMNNMAVAYIDCGRSDEAVPILERALAVQNAKLGPDHLDTLQTKEHLAAGHIGLGRVDEAVPLFEQVLASLKKQLGTSHPDTLKATRNAIGTYQRAGRFEDAIALLKQLLEKEKETLGAPQRVTVVMVNNLAQACRGANRLDEALSLSERAQELARMTFGPDDSETIKVMNDLAATYWSVGRLAQSVPLFEDVVNASTKANGADHPQTLLATANLAVNYWHAGRLPEAIQLFEQTLSRARQKPENFSGILNWVPGTMAQAYEAAGELAKAERLLREFRDKARQQFGDQDLRTSELLALLGRNLILQDRGADAEPILRESLAIREASQRDNWLTFNARSMLGGSLLGQKRYADAEPLLVSGYEEMRKREANIPVPVKVRLAEALDRVVRLYEEWDKPEEATKWRAIDPLALAQLAGARNENRKAVKFYREAFHSQPVQANDSIKGFRYNAACAGALAADGQGADANDLSTESRDGWRRQALAWLRADLDAWKQRLSDDADRTRSLVTKSLAHWQKDPDLKSVRDETALATLPADESSAWQKLWNDVAVVLASANLETTAD